ncbi:DEAD/DEAH box helicase family protein [Colwellia hornerae]|uniref:DEAD/DEAH box helicase n=1 Tax=Colwellia hornerae TaxID=89402 RepID=A0A5C6QF95_9GAMM|nr:DEAD/DEAH box helicase family protein [Colwellia hornerae]TWX52643.1 DEAD/DEAH box helicase [Colwellia hornerae]TWX58406.1 DEAD/DEAH box helicase [Colwellia hornerae]TWX67458.1 DEAD/DEAH box helicase [Colwellia hornerae]
MNQLKQKKYLCIEKSGIILPEGALFDSFYQDELTMFLNEQCELEEFTFIIAVTKHDAVYGAELAIRHGISLSVEGVEYKFEAINLEKYTNEQKYRALLAQAKEPQLFESSLQSLLNSLIKKIPLKYTKEEVIKLVVDAAPTELQINGIQASVVAFEKAKIFFEDQNKKIEDFIQPRESEFVKVIKMSYQNELVEHIKSNPGVYILNDKMGSGKSQSVILPLFNYFSTTDEKPILIAPTKALTKQLVNDARNYQYQKKNNNNITVSGVAACVISATTNWKYKKFSNQSKISLIEEYEECESSLCSKKLMHPQTLSRCSEAMDHWLTLLQKQTVVIADAMFSNFSALQLVKMRKNITVVKNTDIGFPFAKELIIQPYELHLKSMLMSLKNDDKVAAFCDGSHAYDAKFKNIQTAIEKETGNKPIVVDRGYIDKTNPEYFVDIEKSLEEGSCHLYSPVITSGVSIVTDAISSVHIFACQTLLPTQLIQSSGRFRKSNVIHISFSSYEHYQTTGLNHIFNEQAYEAYELESKNDLAKLKKDNNCIKVLERLNHNRIMRRNYVYVSLKLFDKMGYKITIDGTTNTKELAQSKKYLKQIKKFDTDTFISVVQQAEYDNINYHFLQKSEQDLIASELLKLEAMTLLQFYNLTSIEEKSEAARLVEFDDKAKSRVPLKNVSIFHKQFCEVKEPKKAIICQIFDEIFSILNINVTTFTGKYYSKNVDELINYICTKKIIFKNEEYIVRKELIKLGCSTSITLEFNKRGVLTRELLKKLFKITQISKRSGTGQRLTEYYYLCPDQSSNVLYYYNLRYGEG